jgi:glyoxylase-like metal-dependent hydrolase (beta-lactamase superfamily II)
MKKHIILLLLLTFGLCRISSGQINPDSVKVETRSLGGNLHLLSLYGCNCLALTGPDGTLLVDACYQELGEKLNSEIQKIKPQPIKYLVNTHWHFDHTGGNLVLGKKALVIAHDSTRVWLSKDEPLLGDTIKAQPLEVLPKITFSDRMNIYCGNEEVHLIALPGGHTGSDILVYFKNEKVLHIGDLVFSDMFPFCDVTHGGNVMTMAANLESIITSFPADIRIIPGHGREYNMEDLKKYRIMILTTAELVSKEIKTKSLDEIKKEQVLRDWNDWGLAFSCDDWIEMIYESLRPR